MACGGGFGYEDCACYEVREMKSAELQPQSLGMDDGGIFDVECGFSTPLRTGTISSVSCTVVPAVKIHPKYFPIPIDAHRPMEDSLLLEG